MYDNFAIHLKIVRMKMKFDLVWFVVTFALALCMDANANIIVRSRLNQSLLLTDTTDLHLTASSNAIADSAVITLASADSWLFFDSIKPNDVIAHYASHITINHTALLPEVNGRVCVYRHGTVVIPHGAHFKAMELSGNGMAQSFQSEYYYSSRPSVYVPDSLRMPLTIDNAATHIHLKRGYMATLACEPDGMGYSRVFVADNSDLDTELPVELNNKVSFVRVLPWQYPDKKGWAGSVWKEMPVGLKYCYQQCDSTNSTWYYNWGLTPTVDPSNPDYKTYNQEFVPEKWGAGGDPAKMFTTHNASHLLGYNEPDHTEQSNVSVDKAVEEWPLLLQTGLRLGSPATTNFSWLYDFMSKCRKRNYRVDFVVVHAYWGGMSADEWYRKLKDVHDHTKRPIWIKEWNNGANWTKESWPSSKGEQYAKQLRDLKAIVNMLDTCSFIERYSIYNWVEDKRMIINNSGDLTPAGKFYANNTPAYFFNHEEEYVPQWMISDSPELRYDSILSDTLHISWTDTNGEQIAHYACYADETLLTDTITGKKYALPLQHLLSQSSASIALKSIPADSTKAGQASNSLQINSLPYSPGKVNLGTTTIWQSWMPQVFEHLDDEPPVTILGVPTYRNKMPLAPAVRQVDNNHFDAALLPWLYQQHPVFFAPDTVSYISLPLGAFHWGMLQGYSGRIDNLDEEWHHVQFIQPFSTTPVVVATPVVNNDTTITVAIKNVSTTGFDIRERYEEAVKVGVVSSATYLALDQGEGSVGQYKVVAGITPDASVGAYPSNAYSLLYIDSFDDRPYVYAQIISMHDSITSTLRQRDYTRKSTVLFRDREKSKSHTLVQPEQVAYLLIGKAGNNTGIDHVRQREGSDYYVSLSGEIIRSRPVQRGVYIQVTEKDKRKIIIR